MGMVDAVRPIVTFETLAADIRAAEAAAAWEARANPPPPRPPNAGDIQRMLEERRLAAAVGRDEREAEAEIDRQRVFAGAHPAPPPGACRASRVRHLLAGATPDALRADLRAAIAAREAAEAAHREAEEDLSSCRETVAAIEAALECLTEDDDDKDARAVSNFRSGRLGAGVDFNMELDRGAEEARLDDARRAERVLAAAVGEAHAIAMNAKESVEVIAAALVTVQIDAFAEELERAEARAATLRTLLLSGGNAALVAPGVTPIPGQATARMRRLAMEGSANARVVLDQKIVAVFQKHFAALLEDPEASLATMGSAGQPSLSGVN